MKLIINNNPENQIKITSMNEDERQQREQSKWFYICRQVS